IAVRRIRIAIGGISGGIRIAVRIRGGVRVAVVIRIRDGESGPQPEAETEPRTEHEERPGESKRRHVDAWTDYARADHSWRDHPRDGEAAVPDDPAGRKCRSRRDAERARSNDARCGEARRGDRPRCDEARR